MKKLIVLLLLILFSMNAYSQKNEDEKIKLYAREKWKTDYSMIKYEIEKQIEAKKDFLIIYNKFDCSKEENSKSSEECSIIINAFIKWKVEDTDFVDWTMVLYETKKQLEAYNEIK